MEVEILGENLPPIPLCQHDMSREETQAAMVGR
jgi:hypothetical protein